MRLGGNIGVHAQLLRRRLAQPARALGKSPQLRLTLYIEEQDARFQRSRQLFARLSNSRKYNSLPSFRIGGQYPLQFSAGDHIEAATLLRQQPQNTQVGVRFNGIADEMR